MLINLRNALMTGKRLPYDAELEYLESTGTQWIDTGVYQSPTIGAKIDLMITGYTQNTSNIMMSGSDSWRWGFGYVWNTKSLQVSGICVSGTTWASYPMTENARHSIQYNLNGDKTCYIDGVLKRSGIPTGTVQSPGPIYLFTANYNGGGTSWRPSVMRCYDCQIYDGNNLVRDFIPVRVGTVGYLYDRVSGNLFGNAGTGDFVLGQDKN